MATCLRYPGKVVIVTGGTSGIGLAIVREFVHQGANVVFCSRACGAERGQAIQRDLKASGCPGDAFYQVCDVQKESDIKRLIQVTVQRYGCLDCLVNNAGIGYMEEIDDVSAQDFLNVMEINTVSCLLTSKYALPYLRETKGNIINIADIDGEFGEKNFVSYASSKGAVIAMTKALAIDESKYGVRVNSISPSAVWTPLLKRVICQSPNPEAVKQYFLMGRLGTPEEVALAALFLAADGTFCTGLDLALSGGSEVGFGMKNEMNPMPQPSKVVIVTGGTSGIGLAIVREFVHQGSNVVFCSQASEAEKGQAIQRELQASGCPGDALYQICDVQKEADIKRLICVTVERYGCLDCLVNNVGKAYKEMIENVSAHDFLNVMEINTVSGLLASKYALPYLRETKGNIINMASISGVFGEKNFVSYVSSKGAVIAMTKALAIDESKYGVRVNSGGAEVGFGMKNQVDPEPQPSAGGNSQGFSSKQ
ncbi:UNVERIFIED_CONTAM: hypothetical protein K2H54_038782 [Gekko kuhli]